MVRQTIVKSLAHTLAAAEMRVYLYTFVLVFEYVRKA